MMETLSLHIEYLLTRHDCVIVPGIGAFIATETEACIDIENGIVSPRRREISFNSSVVTDDGLLAHSIARKEHLHYEVAHRRLAFLIEKMKADLHLEGEISLGMLGKLIEDAEGLISFQPRRSSPFTDILGDIILKVNEPALADAAETKPNIVTETIEHDESCDGMRSILVSPDRYVFTIRKRVVHIAAMLVTILTVGLSLMIPINHDNEQKASVISFDEFFRRPVTTDIMKHNDSLETTTLKNDSIAVEGINENVK